MTPRQQTPSSQNPGWKNPGWNVWGLLPTHLIMLCTLIIPIGIIILVSFSTRGPYGGFDYVFTTAPYKQILFNEGWTGELEFKPPDQIRERISPCNMTITI